MNSGSLARTEENAHKIADEDQRGTAQNFEENAHMIADEDQRGTRDNLQTLTAHSSHHCPKLRENATRKSVTKVFLLGTGEKKRKREKRKIGEYVGKCAKMKLVTKRVRIKRKIPARKVLTILLNRTLAVFQGES